MIMTDSERQAMAFNEGSDARLEGLSLKHNPYHGDNPRVLAAWREGWCDVHGCWGMLVRGRWLFRKLPEVRYVNY